MYHLRTFDNPTKFSLTKNGNFHYPRRFSPTNFHLIKFTEPIPAHFLRVVNTPLYNWRLYFYTTLPSSTDTVKTLTFTPDTRYWRRTPLLFTLSSLSVLFPFYITPLKKYNYLILTEPLIYIEGRYNMRISCPWIFLPDSTLLEEDLVVLNFPCLLSTSLKIPPGSYINVLNSYPGHPLYKILISHTIPVPIYIFTPLHIMWFLFSCRQKTQILFRFSLTRIRYSIV